jgi:hypothetical protein
MVQNNTGIICAEALTFENAGSLWQASLAENCKVYAFTLLFLATTFRQSSPF